MSAIGNRPNNPRQQGQVSNFLYSQKHGSRQELLQNDFIFKTTPENINEIYHRISL